MTIDELFRVLSSLQFWCLKTENGREGRRGHSCTIRHGSHIYTAYRGSPSDAMRAAIAKMTKGPSPRRRSRQEAPMLRLVESDSNEG